MEKDDVCLWTQADDEESNNWESDCGDMFYFESGTPKGNGFKFCPYCGKKIDERLYVPVDDEDF